MIIHTHNPNPNPRGVSEELNKMRTKEKYVNNSFAGLTVEFKEVKKLLEELSVKGAKSNDAVSRLTNEVAELSEKLEETKENFESKDSGMNDTSPLVRIKASLQQIKAEIYSFDMRVGVVSHSLLTARVNAANLKRGGAAIKARQRRNNNAQMRGGGVGVGAGGVGGRSRGAGGRLDTGDDESMLSGDE